MLKRITSHCPQISQHPQTRHPYTVRQVSTNSMIIQSSTFTEPLAGELIVRNGPDRGVSRSLLVPVTLVGSGENCDLRILDETVRPVHCAISVTPDGPHLRSVGGLTPVNGIPSSSRLLQT